MATRLSARRSLSNNTSAWSGAERSEWQKVLSLVEQGKIDGVVTYNIDRIVRRMSDLVKLLEVVKAHNVCVYSVRGGEIDLSTEGGIMIAQILTAVAEHESSIKSARVIRAKVAAAEAGLPSGGPRPFGFKDDRITHDPGEAKALKKAVKEFLREGILSDAVEVIRSEGFPMNSRRLRDMLITGRIAGRRDYVSMKQRRERAGGKSTTYLYVSKVKEPDAAWDPIISDDEWLACRSILLDPKRTRGKVRRSRSLLAGLIVCGECGGYMSVGRDYYRCQSHHDAAGGAKGCGGTAIRTDLVESTVHDLCKVRLSDTEGINVLLDRTPDAKRRRELLDRRSSLATSLTRLVKVFAGTAASTEAIEEEVALIQTRIDEIDDELADLTQAEVVAATLDLRAELLDAGDVETQRRVIGALIQEVIIYRVGKGVPRASQPFPESWTVWWKGGDRPTRPGKPTTSVRMETAGRKAVRAAPRRIEHRSS